MIACLVVPNAEGKPSVGVILGAADVFLTTEGAPMSGVALSPGHAREVAQRLLRCAEAVETGQPEAKV